MFALGMFAGGGPVSPESLTHGISAQRYKWCATGYRTGAHGCCDTFQGLI